VEAIVREELVKEERKRCIHTKKELAGL